MSAATAERTMSAATAEQPKPRAGVAEHLDVSVWQVDRLEEEGMLPDPVIVGKRKRWFLSEINEKLKAAR